MATAVPFLGAARVAQSVSQLHNGALRRYTRGETSWFKPVVNLQLGVPGWAVHDHDQSATGCA